MSCIEEPQRLWFLPLGLSTTSLCVFVVSIRLRFIDLQLAKHQNIESKYTPIEVAIGAIGMTSFIPDDESMSLGNLSVSMASMIISDNDSDDPDGFLLPEDEPSPPDLFIEPRHQSSRQSSPIASIPARLKPDDPIVQAFNEEAQKHLAVTKDNAAKFSVVISVKGFEHVYSRYWTTKREQSSIVERPERLKACYLGIGMARAIVPFELFTCSQKSSLFSPHVEAVHGSDWAIQISALCSKAAEALKNQQLEVPESWPSDDIYLSPNTVNALECNLSAIEIAVQEIFESKRRRAFIALRPPGHHCHEEDVSGFCLMNNAHVAIQYAKLEYGITHAVILDFDLHHGDGSQDLLWKLGFSNDENASFAMGYFSIHDINSFPCEFGYATPEKLSNASVCFVAHNSAIWNVHLKPYSTDEEFSTLYNSEYSVLFTRAAEYLQLQKQNCNSKRKPFKPLVVLSSGFDGSEFETPGMQRHEVHVPTSFYNRFTLDAIALAERYGQGYLLSLLEGGYSSAAIATGVFSHLTGMGLCPYDKAWCPTGTPSEINMGMRQRWKHHPEKWTSAGISMGRTLFPAPESMRPYTAPAATAIPSNKRNLRPRKTSF